MIVINLFGGPCAGKSVTASVIFAYLKNRGVRAELVGEVAKTFIYEGREHLLHPSTGNQLFVLSTQYSRLYDLSRSGCTVAIADSPLMQNNMYARGDVFYDECMSIARRANHMWPSINVFIERTEHFDPFGRIQKDLVEATTFDERVREYCKDILFHVTGVGSEEGQKQIAADVYSKLLAIQNGLKL